MGSIYLIPAPIGDGTEECVLSSPISSIVSNIRFFIVENVRTARRYLKRLNKSIDIDSLSFVELNKSTDYTDTESFLAPALEGKDIGVISEAGCPGVADPGAEIVKLAHTLNIRVIPLVGPSSILLALMASGMNGQNFAFIGYLPIKKQSRIKSIQSVEKRSFLENQTQVFIETPYRNMNMLKDLLATCNCNTLLCIACDITMKTEYIKTKTVKEWKNALPDIHKRPTIFLLQRPHIMH